MSPQSYRFIVIERDLIVARDLSDGLRAACPSCDVLHLRCASEMPESLSANSTHPPVILTKLPVQQVEDSGMAHLAREQGATIVVRQGDDPLSEVAHRGWLSLTSPFSWDDLAALIHDLRQLGMAS